MQPLEAKGKRRTWHRRCGMGTEGTPGPPPPPAFVSAARPFFGVQWMWGFDRPASGVGEPLRPLSVSVPQIYRPLFGPFLHKPTEPTTKDRPPISSSGLADWVLWLSVTSWSFDPPNLDTFSQGSWERVSTSVYLWTIRPRQPRSSRFPLFVPVLMAHI